jgi:hypothetical protein
MVSPRLDSAHSGMNRTEKARIVWERCESLSWTESVSFKAVLQRGNRVQIPRLSVVDVCSFQRLLLLRRLGLNSAESFAEGCGCQRGD